MVAAGGYKAWRSQGAAARAGHPPPHCVPPTAADPRAGEARHHFCTAPVGFPRGGERDRRFKVLPDSVDTDLYIMSIPSWINALSVHKLFLMVAVVMKAESEAEGSMPTYQWKDYVTGEMATCNKCRPGTFVASHCTRESPTNCQPCPTQHYTAFWNYAEQCRYCHVFCGERELEAQPCNATQNRQCKCQPGFFLDSEFCIAHSLCLPGFGVLKLGTEYEDTQCQPCLEGTFSNSSSSTESCRPHRNCQTEGLKVNVVGTQYENTLCMYCHLDDPSSTQKECESDALEFLASYISPKQLKRLLRQPVDFEKPPTHTHQKKKSLKKLQDFFGTLKDSNPSQSMLTGLLQRLERAHLNSIKKAIQERFYKVGSRHF